MNNGTCIVCGTSLAGKRSDAVTCGDRCRKSAERNGLSKPRVPVKSRRIQPSRVPSRQRKPSRDDLARLICDTAAIEASFRFAATKADYRFRPMCARLADAIARALEQEGLD